jgi:hypothetical protein
VARLLLWALQERGPVRCCGINSLPRGSAPPPQGSRKFVTTSQINSQHWPKLCPGARLSVIEYYFAHISSQRATGNELAACWAVVGEKGAI